MFGPAGLLNGGVHPAMIDYMRALHMSGPATLQPGVAPQSSLPMPRVPGRVNPMRYGYDPLMLSAVMERSALKAASAASHLGYGSAWTHARLPHPLQSQMPHFQGQGGLGVFVAAAEPGAPHLAYLFIF